MDKVHKFDLASEAFVKDAADLRDLVSKTIAYDASMYVTEEICRKYLRHRHELSQSVSASTATFADLDRGIHQSPASAMRQITANTDRLSPTPARITAQGRSLMTPPSSVPPQRTSRRQS